MTKSALEALVNVLLAPSQPITANGQHKPSMQHVIDELYDAQSRADVLQGVADALSLATGDKILIIRSGGAKLVPTTLFIAGTFITFTTAGSTTAYTGTPSPALTAYANTQKFQIKANATSTGAVTMNVSGLGAKKVFISPTVQADAGDLVQNQTYFMVYDSALDTGAGGFLITGGAAVNHFKGVYADETALETAYPTAAPGDYALVDVGSSEAELYIWDDTDTDWVASGVTTVVPPWDDATPGIVERSLTAEAQNIVTRTVAGSSDASNSDARTPSEKGLVEMLLSFLQAALTWAAKQTFTTAPRFSSTTATTFLGVDSNKDLVSHAEASQAEMITGTAQDRVATPKSVEDKGSVKLRDISNSATGTNNIDCQNQDTVHVVFTTALTGANEITVSNAGNLQVLNVVVPITGASIPITVPSTTRMDRAFETTVWNQSSKILTVAAVGTADLFELSFKRSKSDGSVFILRYGGPARA